LLGAQNLLGTATQQLLKESEEAEEEITDALYGEYKNLRTRLIDHILGVESVSPLDAVGVAQTILDRILFIAFAEDRGLLPKGTLQKAYEVKNPFSPQPAWENFKGLFSAINAGNPDLKIPGYNGGLFAENETIVALALPDELCASFAALGRYDYDSEVSVTILGHVFEQSVADLEEIKRGLDPDSAQPEAVGSKRRTDGIFYTPPFVTRYIVESTVGRWLLDRKKELGFDDIEPLTDADYGTIRIANRG
jgi:hypothetical protein